MRTSVVTFDTRARERFHTLAGTVRYHARPGTEADYIDRVITAVRAGHLAVRDGHDVLAHVRRDQLRHAA